ncbi:MULTISPECIES: bis(5'-nucleosyl)-tetraphosphatase [unclassified Coleofasciculus]|uniref:bis(5'-nucleosyl)-tetraphosphatase n=1 Tax=unclassified Coleofasciculus TaxID=2692782 RepID=UPI00187F24FE|nr:MULTISPECIES: NUDIX domain-containing protein [unclassified Coleofasciculus]MBE9127239.1 NUDIX domain-containing protein [Coleofasciculus sp. LEGE 07081]MBE9150609.1 NUDIX domain-containing protein [Coleofasciculus sp. LEGE 07092]
MRQFKSCGFIVMRTVPQLSFLLMQHPHRYDLPKGHMETGEDEWDCALRELHEETGIPASALKLDRTFRFTNTYKTRYKRYGKEKIEKTVVIFLGWLEQKVTVQLTEHSSYQWVEWNPPHLIQKKTIDPLLGKLERYLLENTAKRLN